MPSIQWLCSYFASLGPKALDFYNVTTVRHTTFSNLNDLWSVQNAEYLVVVFLLRLVRTKRPTIDIYTVTTVQHTTFYNSHDLKWRMLSIYWLYSVTLSGYLLAPAGWTSLSRNSKEVLGQIFWTIARSSSLALSSDPFPEMGHAFCAQ